MASRKPSNFDPAGSLNGSEIVPVIKNGLQARTTAAAIAALGGIEDLNLRNDLEAATGAALIGTTQSGIGAVAQTVQSKLRNLPKQSTEYDTFAHFITGATPAGFFAQNAAIIQRAERLMLGGAMFSDCAIPNINQDWLTQLQIAAGLSAGSVLTAQFASLNTGTTAETAATAILGAIQTKYFTSAGTDGISTESYVYNNNATLATPAWAYYGEAHKLTAASGSTYFIEGDLRTLVDSVTPTPFQQGDVIGFQMGSGAGLSAVGQFDASAAFQIVANPKKFKVGINFLNDSLVSGLAIHLAAMASNPHRLQWTNAGNNAAGSISSTAVGANANRLTFTDNGLQVSGADSSAVAYFNTLTGGANWLTFSGAATGAGPTIAVAGGDTNIDLPLLPKGTGLVKFGALTANADAPVTGYISIKDSGGTTRKLAVIA